MGTTVIITRLWRTSFQQKISNSKIILQGQAKNELTAYNLIT